MLLNCVCAAQGKDHAGREQREVIIVQREFSDKRKLDLILELSFTRFHFNVKVFGRAIKFDVWTLGDVFE